MLLIIVSFVKIGAKEAGMLSYLRVYHVDPCDILEVENIGKVRIIRHRMECC
jgi:hypothetical protein